MELSDHGISILHGLARIDASRDLQDELKSSGQEDRERNGITLMVFWARLRDVLSALFAKGKNSEAAVDGISSIASPASRPHPPPQTSSAPAQRFLQRK